MSALKDFRAAIFDLDGTLLDSMYVWRHVDELFFAERGLTLSPDYAQAIAGMSYRESALYTKSAMGLRNHGRKLWTSGRAWQSANTARTCA